ncbi:MAG: hypothetical protein BGN87_12500 [Rhizobiales bacterium 65-79]|jgi:hypothetical protein|nr:hypothetical protein [Hyphomicrobiales bacterium]OJU06093.1 MAG: hypothetical protein BGN87_12500 [Rhizobiales bacterium 65-79]
MRIRTFALTAAAALFVAGPAFAQSSGTGSATGGQNGATTTMGAGAASDKAGKAAIPSNMHTGSVSGSMYKSSDEKMLYQKNADIMGPFFTNRSMSKLKSKRQIRKIYKGMNARSQATLTKSCDGVKGQRGSYGTMTMTLCQDIGTM